MTQFGFSIADLEADVHAIHHILRSAEPISYLASIDAWLVTSHPLAVQIMRDAKTYTVDHPNFSTGQVVGPSMLSLDGAAHAAHRVPFERPFRKINVIDRFQHYFIQEANRLLAQIQADGAAELQRTFAGPIAVRVMLAALGLDDIPVDIVLGWYDEIVQAVTDVTEGKPIRPAGHEAFAALGKSLLPALRKAPSTSLLAAASGLASGLSDEQIISNAAVLLFGGIETTEGMIANAFYHLLTNQSVMDSVLGDDGLLPAVVEESLRLEPAASVVDRYTTRAVTIGQHTIPKDVLVRVSLAAANHDPTVFEQPDVFDLNRPNLKSHLTFAQGPHVCLGIHLARLEAHWALKLALQQLPKLRLQPSELARQQAIPRGLVFRKPKALHVAWGE